MVPSGKIYDAWQVIEALHMPSIKSSMQKPLFLAHPQFDIKVWDYAFLKNEFSVEKLPAKNRLKGVTYGYYYMDTLIRRYFSDTYSLQINLSKLCMSFWSMKKSDSRMLKMSKKLTPKQTAKETTHRNCLQRKALQRAVQSLN